MSRCVICGREILANEIEYHILDGNTVCPTCAEHIENLSKGINPYAVQDAKRYFKKNSTSVEPECEKLLMGFLKSPKQTILKELYIGQLIDESKSANGYRMNEPQETIGSNFYAEQQYTTPVICTVFTIFALICWAGGVIIAISAASNPANRAIGVSGFSFIEYFVYGCICIAISSVIKYLAKIENHLFKLEIEHKKKK